MIGPEGHDFHDARAGHEPAYRVTHQSAADACPACVLGDDEPAHIVGRGFHGEEQAAERLVSCLRGGDEGGTPADVPGERCLEAWFTGHGPEPVLDLRREPDDPGCVILASWPDVH
jgi:hypothetical protein